MQSLLDQVDVAMLPVWLPDGAGEEGSDKLGPDATVEDIVKGRVAKTDYKSPVISYHLTCGSPLCSRKIMIKIHAENKYVLYYMRKDAQKKFRVESHVCFS